MENGIGQLNGKWEMLFKATMSAVTLFIPLSMMWFTWATVQLFELKGDMRAFIAVGPRYTPDHARIDNLELKQDIVSEMELKYPPIWLKAEVAELAERMEKLEEEGKN